MGKRGDCAAGREMVSRGKVEGTLLETWGAGLSVSLLKLHLGLIVANS